MPNTIVFIETSDIGARYLRDSAKLLGLNPIFAFREGNYQGDTLAQLKTSEHVLADTRSVPSILSALAKLPQQPIAVLSILDSYMTTAFEVGTQLGSHVPDVGISKSKDKGLVSGILGPFGPKTHKLLLSQSEEEWEAALRSLLYESPAGILLKPRFGSGALGLRFINSKEEIRSVRDSLLREKDMGCPEANHWLAQSRIDGQLVSYEGFWELGKLNAFGFTGRSKVGKTESRAYFPHDAKLSFTARELAAKALTHLFRGLNIESTYFHTEFIFSENEAHLIDANIGRIGGGPIGEMVALSLRLDPVLLYAHYILNSLPALANATPRVALEVRKAVASAMERERVETLSLLYGASVECLLQELRTPPRFQSTHTQLLSAGTRVPAMGTNNWDWIGILTGLPQAVWNDYSHLRLSTDQGIITPVC